MYNSLATEKELGVKIGDTVIVQGNRGTVTEVIRSCDTEWVESSNSYHEIVGTERISVRVHFEGSLAEYKQYQDQVYGGFSVVIEVESPEASKTLFKKGDNE